MMNNVQMDAKVFEINMLEAQIKELKALAEARKAELKAELDERNVEMIDTGINRIWYKLVEKNTLDTKKAKEELKKVDKLEQCMKSSIEIRFTITHKSEE
jgi:predicted phage-related endonuclease